MILPLIITIIVSWVLVLSVVVGLCLSARQGDLQQQQAAPAYATSDLIEPSVISPRITAPPGRHAYPCNPAGFTSSATG